MESIYQKLCEIVAKDNVLIDENMAKHTSFKVGGNAKYFVLPKDEKELTDLLKFVFDNRIKYYVIGNGSNLLVKDSGFDGIIIKIGNNMSKIEVKDNIIKCQAGAFLSKIASVALENSLSGLEFAAGIPGLVGGAVAMNAGAYGGEFKDVVTKVWLLDKEGNSFSLKNNEMEFGYRESIVQKKEYIVTGVELRLEHGNKVEIEEKMNEFLKARKDKQPLEYPSAGSTFKRPVGHFAGKLIMDAGLKGYSVGGACVSEKHCGFVINKQNATATDIIELMDKVSDIVYEKYGVKLEAEVKII